MYSLTFHATQRSAQRSIPPEIIDLILTLGDETKQPGKAIKLELNKKISNRVVKNLKDAIKMIEKAQKKAVITNTEGTKIITVINSR